MKILLVIFAAACFVLLPCAPARAQRRGGATLVNVADSFNAASYRVGERLTYNVSFSNFISAAHVELLVAARGQFFDREALQLRAHVETTGVVSAALYALNNDYITYVDTATGLPFRTQQLTHDAVADAADQSALPSAATTPLTQAGITAYPTTYDFLAALYRVRALPLTDDTVFRFSVQQADQAYGAELRVVGHETVKTSTGSFSTIVTQVRVPRDAVANNYNVRVYFSDDARHVPVRLTAQHPAGEIRADLVSVELPPAAAPTATTSPAGNVAQAPGNVPPANASKPSTPTSPSTTTSSNLRFPPNLPFTAGEQLNFNLYLGNAATPVGTASFQVRARAKYFNRDGIQITARAQTTQTLARAFVADDQITSYVDATSLLPFRTEYALREGRRRVNQLVNFDQDRGNAVTDKGARIEIPVGTYDFVSVLYALRSFNLTPSTAGAAQPKRNAVSLLVNNRPRTLTITSLRRETIQLGTQSVPAIQLSLTTDDTPGDKYAFRLWVSADRRRLPLRVTAQTELGLVRADLAIIPLTSQ